ncbi:MAG: hypothetical protein KC731_31535, partial [Myxococcales bacterium]|nr:hypothetical protein [Myxococcales bacterium]
DAPGAAPTAATNDGPEPAPSAAPRPESAILAEAQRSLASDPARALALCDEHARSHPRGSLGQEREMIAIDALQRLGRTAEARARAAAFRARHPTSGHNRRLDVLLGE